MEEADEAELADTCGGGELVEADVPLRPVPEEVIRQVKRPVVVTGERRSHRPDGGRALDQRAQPLSEPLIVLKPRRGRLERTVHSHEVASELAIRQGRFGEHDVGEERRLLVTGQGCQVGNLDDYEAGCPWLPIDRGAGVRVRRIPGNELPRPYEAAFPATARAHRFPGDDPEDVFPARLDGVLGGLARHQQNWARIRGTPHPDRVGPHVGRIVGNNVQEL